MILFDGRTHFHAIESTHFSFDCRAIGVDIQLKEEAKSDDTPAKLRSQNRFSSPMFSDKLISDLGSVLKTKKSPQEKVRATISSLSNKIAQQPDKIIDTPLLFLFFLFCLRMSSFFSFFSSFYTQPPPQTPSPKRSNESTEFTSPLSSSLKSHISPPRSTSPIRPESPSQSMQVGRSRSPEGANLVLVTERDVFGMKESPILQRRMQATDDTICKNEATVSRKEEVNSESVTNLIKISSEATGSGKTGRKPPPPKPKIKPKSGLSSAMLLKSTTQANKNEVAKEEEKNSVKTKPNWLSELERKKKLRVGDSLESDFSAPRESQQSTDHVSIDKPLNKGGPISGDGPLGKGDLSLPAWMTSEFSKMQERRDLDTTGGSSINDVSSERDIDSLLRKPKTTEVERPSWMEELNDRKKRQKSETTKGSKISKESTERKSIDTFDYRSYEEIKQQEKEKRPDIEDENEGVVSSISDIKEKLMKYKDSNENITKRRKTKLLSTSRDFGEKHESGEARQLSSKEQTIYSLEAEKHFQKGRGSDAAGSDLENHKEFERIIRKDENLLQKMDCARSIVSAMEDDRDDSERIQGRMNSKEIKITAEDTRQNEDEDQCESNDAGRNGLVSKTKTEKTDDELENKLPLDLKELGLMQNKRSDSGESVSESYRSRLLSLEQNRKRKDNAVEQNVCEPQEKMRVRKENSKHSGTFESRKKEKWSEETRNERNAREIKIDREVPHSEVFMSHFEGGDQERTKIAKQTDMKGDNSTSSNFFEQPDSIISVEAAVDPKTRETELKQEGRTTVPKPLRGKLVRVNSFEQGALSKPKLTEDKEKACDKDFNERSLTRAKDESTMKEEVSLSKEVKGALVLIEAGRTDDVDGTKTEAVRSKKVDSAGQSAEKRSDGNGKATNITMADKERIDGRKNDAFIDGFGQFTCSSESDPSEVRKETLEKEKIVFNKEVESSNVRKEFVGVKTFEPINENSITDVQKDVADSEIIGGEKEADAIRDKIIEVRNKGEKEPVLVAKQSERKPPPLMKKPPAPKPKPKPKIKARLKQDEKINIERGESAIMDIETKDDERKDGVAEVTKKKNIMNIKKSKSETGSKNDDLFQVEQMKVKQTGSEESLKMGTKDEGRSRPRRPVSMFENVSKVESHITPGRDRIVSGTHSGKKFSMELERKQNACWFRGAIGTDDGKKAGDFEDDVPAWKKQLLAKLKSNENSSGKD